MTCMTSLRFAAPIFAVFLAMAVPAMADDPIVKVAPTPMPAAGPTVANAEQFCGDPAGKAEELNSALFDQARIEAGLQKRRLRRV